MHTCRDFVCFGFALDARSVGVGRVAVASITTGTLRNEWGVPWSTPQGQSALSGRL